MKLPLITIPEAPDADPRIAKIAYKKPSRENFWSESRHVMEDWPKLLVIREIVETGEVFRTKLPFYISKKGLYCFRFGPGLFNGMKEASFGQFNYCRSDGKSDYAEMVTGELNNEKDLAHFKKCIARIKRRKAKQKT